MIKELGKEIIDKLVKDTCHDKLVVVAKNPTYRITKSKNRYYDVSAGDCVISAQNFEVICTCTPSNGEIMQTTSPVCPHCGAGIGRRDKAVVLIDRKNLKEITEAYEEANEGVYSYRKGHYYLDDDYLCVAPKSRERFLQTYYVREKFDGTIGIDIVRLTISAVNNNGKLELEHKYDKWCEVVPGKKIVAYKETKAKGQEEIDIFDAFHISSDNVVTDENILFEGASTMIDFIANNTDFAKRTGLDELLKSYPTTCQIPENSLFLLYLFLYSKYPVIELLVKMKYYGLIYELMDKVCRQYRRDSIKQAVDDLSALLNQTTKGTAALSIPTYIGQYLNEKSATYEEYTTWVALYEYEKVSKENFEKIINSEAYWYLNYYDLLKMLPNIIKYGYTFNQCCKYIMQQFNRREKWTIKQDKLDYRKPSPFVSILRCWKDYLETCELMEIAPDKYPQDIIKAHDDIMIAYKAVENEMTDKKLKAIADKYSGYKTTSKYLDIVIPKSVHDFVTEGNNQHNCVGGYANRVQNGSCRIFFIRKIDDMNRSYITAECTKNGLGQLYYRNNTPVTDHTEIEYAKAFCKYILSKPWD